MYFHNTFATFTILILTLAFHARISHAQNSPQDFVDAHNAARAADGVGALAWDNTVAAYAEQYASSRAADCALMHSDSGGLYGENLAQGTVITGLDAVQMWVDEKSNYDYGSNTCADGTMCGHYTQVVWANSDSVGCARVQCDSVDFFVTCNYSPPGNVIGERPF